MNNDTSIFDHRKVRHYDEDGHAHFLTFSCYRRMHLFMSEALRDAFLEHLDRSRKNHGFRLNAWVVMPNHVHLVVLPAIGAKVSNLLLAVKRPFAQRVIRRWRELRAPILDKIVDARGGYHFWQAGPGYDRNIYSVQEVVEKINYIHENPVRSGIVERPEDWRWSSALCGAEQPGERMTPDPW